QVILTHLHFDHVGGAVKRDGDSLVPVFRNATYWSNARHWEWAVNPNPRERASFLKENILPLEENNQLRYIGEDGTVPFSANIRMRFVHGHTEAMMLPQITYKGRTLLYMADLLPSVGHIPIPYVMGYDMFPLKTMEERQSYWNEIVDNDYVLFLEHDAVNECCTLQHTEKGIRLKDTFKLTDL